MEPGKKVISCGGRGSLGAPLILDAPEDTPEVGLTSGELAEKWGVHPRNARRRINAGLAAGSIIRCASKNKKPTYKVVCDTENPPPDGVYKMGELYTEFGVSPSSVDRWVHLGRLKPVGTHTYTDSLGRKQKAMYYRVVDKSLT